MDKGGSVGGNANPFLFWIFRFLVFFVSLWPVFVFIYFNK